MDDGTEQYTRLFTFVSPGEIVAGENEFRVPQGAGTLAPCQEYRVLLNHTSDVASLYRASASAAAGLGRHGWSFGRLVVLSGPDSVVRHVY